MPRSTKPGPIYPLPHTAHCLVRHRHRFTFSYWVRAQWGDSLPSRLHTNLEELRATQDYQMWSLYIVPALYGTRRFITTFTRALHFSLPWGSPIQSTPLHTISKWSILMLSTQLRLGLLSGLLSGLFTNSLFAGLFSPFALYAPPTSSSTTWQL
jgi:hypothetical protein